MLSLIEQVSVLQIPSLILMKVTELPQLLRHHDCYPLALVQRPQQLPPPLAIGLSTDVRTCGSQGYWVEGLVKSNKASPIA